MGLKGAILGDVAGQPFEFQLGIESWQNEPYDVLQNKRQHITDDSVMSIACAEAIADGSFNFVAAYRKYGRKHPSAGYGGRFTTWLISNTVEPYYSFGNGSAMRASACGQFANTKEEAEVLACLSALPTHNHPEGIKGAITLAVCVYMAEHGATKEEILAYGIEQYPKAQYPFSPSIPTKNYHDTVRFDVTCMGAVPIAIRCFYETDNFQNLMQLINSMRVDCDTVGAIAGAIHDSFYKECTKDDNVALKRFLEPEQLYKPYQNIISLGSSHVSDYVAEILKEDPDFVLHIIEENTYKEENTPIKSGWSCNGVSSVPWLQEKPSFLSKIKQLFRKN